jgi:superfamily II DNA/RNA helicase
MVKKLYCYVDETGQDTNGRLFIIVSIVVEDEREELLVSLEQAEKKSGKTKRKWIKTRNAERIKYLDMILASRKLKRKIYYSIFHNTKEYEDLMVLVLGQSINLYAEANNITEYKATIVIDGLKKTETRRVAKSLRQLGVKTHKVRGERDQSNALLRLSDAVAGFIREATEGTEAYRRRVKKLIKEKIINELNP